MKQVKLALAGATGNVGRELIRVLEESDLIDCHVTFLASDRSVGEEIPYKGLESPVENINDYAFKDVQIAIFATPDEVSATHIARAKRAGAYVIDLSNHSSHDEAIPLIANALNGDRLKQVQQTKILASPNPQALALAQVLSPLHRSVGIKRTVVSTYQATSAAGKMAMDEVYRQSVALLGGAGPGSVEVEHFTTQMAFNVIPHVGAFEDNTYTTVENAIMRDTTRLMQADFPVTATAAYVPTFIGDSQSVNITFNGDMTVEKARDILEAADGISVLDNPQEGEYSTPFGAAEVGQIFVSRMRKDPSAENAMNLWIVADNLRVGVAQNVVQLTERLAMEAL